MTTLGHVIRLGMEITEHAVAYEASTQEFLTLADSVGLEQLDCREPGEWSARQIIHHMADSETQSYARLRRLVAEPAGSVIQGYDEAAWAECQALGYEELPVGNSLLVISAVRTSSLDLIRRLTLADLERIGEHTESGPYTVRKWLNVYTAHASDHAAQLRRALNSIA
ncbi:unannotated protein [freshwater metagenome]|uniref:Unannotated protein n=1 Tax=freshwater metagenome TaxID=449393 RepID=A0A6J7GP69_9ZZZZ